ncbi:MAG: hypothetical protein PVF33_08170 [Candidatus Latescibacterota bacterium]|jgi:hypothetical protein
MFKLSNDELEVTLLDPAVDQDRFGTRFCTGGYIFQISDRDVGALLTGPTYPDSFEPFHGQGIPDTFNRAPLRDPENPRLALVIGIGLCDLKEDRVVEFCEWQVDVQEDRFTFRTTQALGGNALSVVREVRLLERTVRSSTRVTNDGGVSFPVAWFAHPFFPQPTDDELFRPNIPVTIPENDGYELGRNGFVRRKNWPWATDYFLAVRHQATSPLTVHQRHPKLGLVAASYSYVPGYFPIWGNPGTFSFEPYLERFVGAGETLVWSMTVDF